MFSGSAKAVCSLFWLHTAFHVSSDEEIPPVELGEEKKSGAAIKSGELMQAAKCKKGFENLFQIKK